MQPQRVRRLLRDEPRRRGWRRASQRTTQHATCPHCDVEVDPFEGTCPRCGRSVTTLLESGAPQPRRRRPWWAGDPIRLALWSLVLIVPLVYLGFVAGNPVPVLLAVVVGFAIPILIAAGARWR
jgi:hypothetical protein